jgi:hypothetical protein
MPNTSGQRIKGSKEEKRRNKNIEGGKGRKE